MGSKNYLFRVKNTQPGVVFLSRTRFKMKAEEYKTMYARKLPHSNIKGRPDYSLISLCRDRVVEEYLHSGKFTFNRIGILMNPFRFAPRTAILMFYSKMPVRVELRMMSGKGNAIYTDDISVRQYHRISITGLENGKNEIVLSLYDEDGNYLRTRSIHITLQNINEDDKPVVDKELKQQSAYPLIFVTGGVLDPFIMNSNGTLFHSLHFAAISTGLYGVYPFMQGRFLWPVRNVCAPSFAKPHSALLYEMDFMGRIYRTYHVKKGIHHFVYMMPNGNLVSFSNSMQIYGSYKEAGHMEDMIVEIDRQTGFVVKEIYLKDIFGERYADMVDWVHGNALEYNEEEDSMLICMRNIHTFAKIRWSSGELIWFMSVPELWKGTEIEDKLLKPVSDIYYNYQAHAAYEVKDFRNRDNDWRFYLVYDNHRLNRRPLEGHSEDGHSYINIFAVNEKEMTVRQVKHLQSDMSIVRSNARYDRFSNHIFNMAGCATREHEDYRGFIEEYEYDTEKLLNRWYIKDDFFAAYPFKWRSDDYCEPLGEIDGAQYACGEVEELAKIPRDSVLDDAGEIAGLKKADKLCFDKPFLEEDYLYFYTKDHSIEALILYGEETCYQVDYSVTWQVEEKHTEHIYYCVVSYIGIAKEKYDLLVRVNGVLYNTGYYIDTRDEE